MLTIPVRELPSAQYWALYRTFMIVRSTPFSFFAHGTHGERAQFL